MHDLEYELAFEEAGRALDATIAFALIGVSVFVVLWPRRDWEFSANATDVIAAYIETASPVTLTRIHRDLALHRSASYERNGAHLRVLVCVR